MKLISLAHERALRYPTCCQTFDPASIQVDDPAHTTFISFACGSRPVRRLSALDRFQEKLMGDVLLDHFDTSPLAAQLLWDIAHELLVGSKLYLMESHTVADLLGRSYYAEAFREARAEGATVRCFIKQQALPVEADSGLDSWSFCIPTGDGDPAALNACVSRILSLNLPEYEIILCGRPHQDFLFWQNVSIVGEDIVATPVHITRKKNVLAQAARYPNLCILHDRVLLPVNFAQAVKQFGDAYPFTTFQSFWFADTWLAVPRRYSDAGVVLTLPEIDFTQQRITRESVSLIASVNMLAKHPARANFGHDYLTGSLCLCKKSVWKHAPQNEHLYWQDYEDIEQALIAAGAGIPSRVNPWSFTLSMSYRSTMHSFGTLTGMKINGQACTQRAPQGVWGFPRRPHLNITEGEARKRLAVFAKKYACNDVLATQHHSLIGIRRYCLVAHLLWGAKGDMKDLVFDWHRYVLCEAGVPSEVEYMQAIMDSMSSPARKKLILLRHPSLLRQIYNNPFSMPFTENRGLFLKKCSLRQVVGSLLSAVWLKYGYRQVSLRLSLFSLWRLIFINGGNKHINKKR
ncbi:MAG: hypothetical protein RSG77_05370 [Hafnia sp.]|uniref:hypothetical protein n=1 Tax=Hafnia sp. TaxID=1873498 RepID=UPI002FCA4F1D